MGVLQEEVVVQEGEGATEPRQSLSVREEPGIGEEEVVVAAAAEVQPAINLQQ